MSGGASDAPPPGPSNGGELLLSLLQRPHQQLQRAALSQPLQPQPPQPIALDPAVAAVGPAFPFPLHRAPSNGHDPSPHWPHARSPPRPPMPLPHNYFGIPDDLGRLGLRFGADSRAEAPCGLQNLRFGAFALEPEPADRPPSGNSVESPGFDSFREHEVGSGSRGYGRVDRNPQFNGRESLNYSGSDSSSSSSSDAFWNQNFGSHKFEQPGVGWGKNQLGSNIDSRMSAPPGFQRVAGDRGFVDRRRGGFEHNAGQGNGSFGDLNRRNNLGVSDGSMRPRGFQSDGHGRVRSDRVVAGQLDPELRSIHANHVDRSTRDVHRNPLVEGFQSDGHRRVRSDRMVVGQLDPELRSIHANHVDRSTRDVHRNPLVEGNRGEEAARIDDVTEQLKSLLEDPVDRNTNENLSRMAHDKEYRSDPRGQRILSQRTRNFKRTMPCRGDIYMLSDNFLRIYESLTPPDEEKARQKQLLSLLERLVNKEWPEARLYLYGSCANSFGVCKSDIDVCLAIDDVEIDKAEFLTKLADILQSDNLQDVQALTRARVPIVKLMDPATGIKCDICINNVLAVVNTKLLRDYAQIDVRLRQLAYIVKHWAKSRGVNETYQGTLSSYAYVLMCIHFLQQRRPAILPCLQKMEPTYSVTVDAIECTYFDEVEKLRDFGARNRESIAQLVWAFFNYWAYCHDYTNSVISVRAGCLLSKHDKDWTRRIGNDRHLICIEDPFDTKHDLGRVVDKFSIKVLREEFERAADIMQHDPTPWITLFEPYVPS